MPVSYLAHPPIFGENAFRKNHQPSEARWTVIANGKTIANGTTIRRNGKVSVSIEQSPRVDSLFTKHDVDTENTKSPLQGKQRYYLTIGIKLFCTTGLNQVLDVTALGF